MKRSQIAATSLWLLTLALAAAVGIRYWETGTPDLPIPGAGDYIDRSILHAEFDFKSPAGPVWLLVLSSDCPGCLRLDSELAKMKSGAACDKAALVPVVVATGSPLDSVRLVLAKHGLPIAGIGGTGAASALGVGIVPTLIQLSETGMVLDASSPAAPENWPPAPTC